MVFSAHLMMFPHTKGVILNKNPAHRPSLSMLRLLPSELFTTTILPQMTILRRHFMQKTHGKTQKTVVCSHRLAFTKVKNIIEIGPTFTYLYL